jgi:hypothetical protein
MFLNDWSMRNIGRNIMNIRMVLLGCVLVSMGCSRPKKETTNVTLEVPPMQSKALNILSVMSDDDYELDDNWSSIAPSGIDPTGTAPINCYAIMVSFPDESLNKSYCGRKQSEDQIEKMFSFGAWAGAVSAENNGGRIQLELPSGKDRVFRLIGFHAQSAAACKDLKRNDVEQGELSRPHIVGLTGGVNLEPGSDKVVTIQRVFDSTKWFDDCKFADPVEEQRRVPTKISIRKLTDPQNIVIESVGYGVNARCVPIEFKVLSAGNRRADLDRPVQVSLKMCENGGGGECNVLSPSIYYLRRTFSSFSQCKNSVDDTSGDVLFNLDNQQSSQIRWVVAPLLSATHFYLKVETDMASIDSSDEVRFAVKGLSEPYSKIVGAKTVLPNVCYKYRVEKRTLGGTLVGSDPYTLDFEKFNGSSWLGESAFVYSEDSCTTPLGTFTVSGGSADVYFKFPSTGSFRITPTFSSVIATEFIVDAKSGSTSPHGLALSGKKFIKADGSTCHGPFQIELRNEYGSLVKRNTEAAGSSIVQTSSPNNSTTGLTFHGSPGCSGTIDFTAASPAVISSTDAAVDFYVRGGSGQSGHRYLEVETTRTDGVKLKGSTEFFFIE